LAKVKGFFVPALPVKLLESLEGIEGYERESFVEVHSHPVSLTSIRVNPSKTNNGENLDFILGEKVAWSDFGYYIQQRPSFTFDPLFHSGVYYVQEASSMFLEQAIKQTVDLQRSLKVLDLCASPGGKSTHLQSLVSKDSLLVSNEVIKGRSLVLQDNILKWGSSNVVVTNNDPSAFQRLPGYFDVLVVDAPCSGSGLFRRNEEAINEWSINNVQLCSKRQQRILADALPCLKEDGILIYSTCSYSREEDENIADWLVNECSMENIHLSINPDWKIITSDSPLTHSAGYRFFPDKVKGEGFFISCFRKKSQTCKGKYREAKGLLLSNKQVSSLAKWVDTTAPVFIKHFDKIYAIQKEHLFDVSTLIENLKVIYPGVRIGELMNEKLIPDHALALSLIVLSEVPFTELSYEQAIKYLQRQDLSLEVEKAGWQMVRYKDYNIGWINALKNRINNYYPKELRILKQYNDDPFEK
jgi:16S rRNA C967 or C1407 C5-methylase (RsmB/RsmF family)/NOL1/NOP2/fmu family ribosome biogenesis protein